MAEDNLASESLPEFPEITHESTPPTDATPENSTLEKIRRAGETVLGKFNITRRGRGRPRKDGSPKASDVVAEILPNSLDKTAPMAAPAANPAYAALFSRAVASAVRGVLGFAKSLVRKKAGQAGIDSEFTEKALRECDVEPEVQNDFNESLAIVLEKYKANTEYAPEIALAIASARMAAPFALLLKTFNDEIERKKKTGVGK